MIDPPCLLEVSLKVQLPKWDLNSHYYRAKVQSTKTGNINVSSNYASTYQDQFST